jgi:hypothetical protein
MAGRLQINIEYKVVEDRLLLRFAETESHGTCIEYRYWLTRRFVQVFFDATEKFIEGELAGEMQLSPEALVAMKQFQQDEALAKADFSTSYGADVEKCTTVGDVPLLITTLNIKKSSKNNYRLSFITSEKSAINFDADINLIYTLRRMIAAAVQNAKWNQPIPGIDTIKGDEGESPGLVS